MSVGINNELFPGVKDVPQKITINENPAIRWLHEKEFKKALTMLFAEISEQTGLEIGILYPPEKQDDVLAQYGYMMWKRKPI